MNRLAPILNHLHRTRAGLERALAAVPDDRWRTAPPGGGWSAAEVVAHLISIETAITDGAAKLVSNPPRRVPFWKRSPVPAVAVSWRSLKRRTPIPLDPALLCGKSEMLAALAARRKLTLEFLQAQSGRDLSQYFSRHPFIGMLSGSKWFWVMGYHEVRHTKQIHEIVGSFHN